MRRLLLLAPFLLVGCSKSPEEAEAAKYQPPKMMSESEAKKFQEAHPDPRNGGEVPRYPPAGGQ